MPLLFVYGTLMYGLDAHGFLAGSVFAGRGYVRGTLYECDGFPLLVAEGEGRVWGELYHVETTQKTRIDHYEGATNPYSPWQEISVVVDVLGVQVNAVAYGMWSLQEAKKRCDTLKPLNTDDYGLVAGRRYARWLVVATEGRPPGIELAAIDVTVEAGRRGSCLSRGVGEEPLPAYDVLTVREELEEWARSMGCRLGGVKAKLLSGAGISVYPLAPVA